MFYFLKKEKKNGKCARVIVFPMGKCLQQSSFCFILNSCCGVLSRIPCPTFIHGLGHITLRLSMQVFEKEYSWAHSLPASTSMVKWRLISLWEWSLQGNGNVLSKPCSCFAIPPTITYSAVRTEHQGVLCFLFPSLPSFLYSFADSCFLSVPQTFPDKASSAAFAGLTFLQFLHHPALAFTPVLLFCL